MLTPRKNSLFELVFSVYNRNLLKRRFASFRVKGLDHLEAASKGPRIIYADHSTWWDGLIAFEISRQARLDAFVMMEERQLRRYRLFRGLGAFSIDTADRRSSYRSLEFASGLLRGRAAPALWIFPQGEIRSALRRPLGFRSGIAEIIRRVPSVDVVPVAIRCEFGGKFKPDVYVSVGGRVDLEPESDSRSEITAELEDALTRLLDGLEQDITRGDFEGFYDLLHGSEH